MSSSALVQIKTVSSKTTRLSNYKTNYISNYKTTRLQVIKLGMGNRGIVDSGNW